MYRGEMESLGHSLAWKLGLHPSTLAHLSSIANNFKKYAPIGPLYHQEDYKLYLTVIICYQYVLWRDRQQIC